MSRKTAIIIMSVCGALLVGLVVFNLLLPPPAAGSGNTEPTAIIGSLVGQVEVQKGGTKRWVAAQVGQKLVEGDEIRTGLFSEASVYVRGESTVVVNPSTSFVIGQDLVKRSQFELGAGQITAAIPKGAAREFQFRSRGSDAIASASRGEFSLTTDGKGTVIVDTQVGDVKLRAQGKEVVVRKGKRSIVLPEKPPSRVLAIPSSVALQVKWPPTKLDRTTTKVTGKTSAGSLVMVNGILVRADPKGQFALDVPLRQGTNRLIVSVTDSAGNTSTKESAEIKVDTRPPDLNVDAKDLWK
ncbi:MAG: FecR domain-containing protein [Deltaproteobacteria bacterium]|nr:FecR domain-containing protein [Deltaproteobacteria bacterium]